MFGGGLEVSRCGGENSHLPSRSIPSRCAQGLDSCRNAAHTSLRRLEVDLLEVGDHALPSSFNLLSVDLFPPHLCVVQLNVDHRVDGTSHALLQLMGLERLKLVGVRSVLLSELP